MFANESAICAEVQGSNKYATLYSTEEIDSIKRYLARPVPLYQDNLFTTEGNIISFNFNNPTDFSNRFTSQQFNKLIGATGWRATLQFDLVVTSSAFNQGIVNLSFQYGTNVGNLARNSQFPLTTNLPSVRLNVAEQTRVSLSVPYVSMREYWPINAIGQFNHDYGIVSLDMLARTRVVAGQDTPTFTLYISAHDVELIGISPTVTSSFVLQSGLRTQRDVDRKQSRDVVSDELKSEGIVSGILSAGANLASAVGRVPSLAPIAGSADWFLRSSAKVASSFGFSRPRVEKESQRMVRYAYAGEGQVDMPFAGFPLSPFSSNKLSVSGATGCVDEDQMSFDYIFSKYAYVYLGNFSSSNAVGDTIYASPVSPSHFWFRSKNAGTGTATGNLPLKASNTATENAFLPSHLCYVGSHFRYWRGGLKFKITFSKTKLHGGRVLFAYTPYDGALGAATPTSTTVRTPGSTNPITTGLSLVFDLQDSSEFEFEVPYLSSEPYCRYFNKIGDVSMRVVQPLRGNGTVASTVDFMVEVCASPGFEFAVPAPSMLQGVARTGPLAVSYHLTSPHSLSMLH